MRSLTGENWCVVADGNAAGRALFHRHYSHRAYKDGRKPKLFVGPGEKLVLLTADEKALFVWRKFVSADGQGGVNCAIFRNESKVKSSELIRDAMWIAHSRWPGERLYTYINRKKIRSVNPGCCFKKAGWKICGETKKGLTILEFLPVNFPEGEE